MRYGAILAVAMLLLAGCGDGAPAGQVAARVDGIEITDREVLGEAAASGADLSKAGVRDALLGRLIDRKLLARAGKAALADRTPAAQIEGRRAREDVLARAYAQRIAAGLTPPGAAEIDRFMRDNPHRFAARTTYLFDRMTTARANAPAIQDLAADTAARALDRTATPYHRQLILIDSDALTPAALRRISALSPGQTLRATTGDDVMLDTLLLRRPVVEPADAQRSRASALVAQRQSTAAVDAAIAALRAKADIDIRPAAPDRPD